MGGKLVQHIMMRLIFVACLFHGVLPLSAMEEFDSRAYHIVTDLDLKEARELGQMMDAYHVFLCQTFGFDSAVEQRMQLRIYGSKPRFTAYLTERKGKPPRSKVAGTYFYGGERAGELVVHWNGRYKGIFFHEGFHQFAHRCWPKIGHWPNWFNEGIASFLETCQQKGGRIGHRGDLRHDYPGKAAEFYRKNPDFRLADFMAKRRNWNKSGYDYAIAATLIATLLDQRNARVRQATQAFFRDLREHQDYDQAVASFSELLPPEHIEAHLRKTYK